MTALTLRLGSRTVNARVDANGEVLIDDAAFAVTADGPGLYLVDDGVRRWRVAVAEAGDARWVSVDGQVAVLEIDNGAAGRKRKKPAAGDAMMSPMPATVVKVLVEAGQAVAEGETVLVLEAMKMELPIRAPRDGVVSVVRCAPGELVQPGVALVDLE
jgi:biotin carboxyl carrier protein